MSGGQRCYVGMIPSTLAPHPDTSTPIRGRQPQRTACKRTASHTSGASRPDPSRRPIRSRCGDSPLAIPVGQIADSANPTEPADPGNPIAETNEGRPPARSQDASLSQLNLSRGGSILRVIAENQKEAPDEFRPWNVTTGLFGGRLGNNGLDTAVERPMVSHQSPTQHSTDEIPSWCNCNALPFSVPAPASLVSVVSDALDVSNSNYAESERCKQQDLQAAFTPALAASPPSASPPGGDSSNFLVECGSRGRVVRHSNIASSGGWLQVAAICTDPAWGSAGARNTTCCERPLD